MDIAGALGLATFLAGAAPFLGYVIGQPVLYTWVEGVAMAFPTTLGFMFGGIGQVLLATMCDRRRY